MNTFTVLMHWNEKSDVLAGHEKNKKQASKIKITGFDNHKNQRKGKTHGKS